MLGRDYGQKESYVKNGSVAGKKTKSWKSGMEVKGVLSNEPQT